MGTFSGKVDPVVRSIALSDVAEALSRGVRDFKAAPTIGLLLGAVCAVTGIAVVELLYHFGMPYLAYPLGAGFAIVAPFLAALLYEVSRRLESGEPISLASVASRVATRAEIRWMGFMVVFVLIMWMYQVRFLMALFLGESGEFASIGEFLNVVLNTSHGLMFLALGNVVGAMLALTLFSLSAVSFPLVLDRDVDFVTAMVTSVKAVMENPLPMLTWAAIIAGVLIISSLPLFLGLLVTMPVLGHATWHLYKRLIAPEPAASDAVAAEPRPA